MSGSARARVLVTREVFDDVLEYLGRHVEVTSNQSDVPFGPEALAAALLDKEGALTSLADRIDAPLLERCPKLRAVCNMAVGYNNIDVASASARGVQVTNTPGVLDEATADFTWALLLAAARRLGEAQDWLRAGHWQGWSLKQFLGQELCGATLGVLGMGRIGQAVARRASGFRMRVLYHSRRRLDGAREQALRASYTSFEELLAQSDFLTIHLPYSPATHHRIGAAELARMKRSAVLVQISRGGVVDDRALVGALARGELAAAGLDVYENEPRLLPEFLALPNAVLAPHIASSTRATRHEMSRLAAQNLVEALVTGRPTNLVNPPSS